MCTSHRWRASSLHLRRLRILSGQLCSAARDPGGEAEYAALHLGGTTSSESLYSLMVYGYQQFTVVFDTAIAAYVLDVSRTSMI